MAIPEFFRDQTIFLTGGTGFIGKVLIEKLLRSCPDIKRIYLAIRPKKETDIHQRWAELTHLAIFDRLKNEQPNALEKVYLINADIKKEDLGITEEDKQTLINEVNIVYHVAATIQFIDNVIDTISQNARSTKFITELCKRMKNFKVLVYASTAYANFYRPESEWDEKIYPAVHDWKVVFKLLEGEPMTLSLLHEKLLCGHPNPYTYSKSMAEDILSSCSDEITTCIVRPSVVMPTRNEPFAGWVDSLNGFLALCLVNILGILRVAWHTNEAHQDYTSADSVAKCLIVCTWITYIDNLKGKKNPTPVYNCASGSVITLKTGDMVKYFSELRLVETTPSKYIVWTRNLWLIENGVLYYTMFYIYQLLPACILDTGIYLYGGKPIFVKIAKKLTIAGTRLFKAFRFACVKFPNSKYLETFTKLEEEDVPDFGVPEMTESNGGDLRLAVADTYLGALKYFLKEDLSKETIEKNKKRYNRIKMMSKTLNLVSYSVFAWLAYRIFDPITHITKVYQLSSVDY